MVVSFYTNNTVVVLKSEDVPLIVCESRDREEHS